MSQRFRTKRRNPNDFLSAPIYPAPDAGEGRTLKTLVDTPEFYGQPGEALVANSDGTGVVWGSATQSLGTFASDSEAGLNGVPIGDFYDLSSTNIYGLPTGVLKRRDA